MIKEELKILCTAILFYTRITLPGHIEFSDERLNKATRYFPFIGILVGGSGAFVFWALNLFLSVHLSVIFSQVLMILLTGAFHEDAFADFCDGFGGGHTKEKILSIMKDSRIGTYGAVGISMLILTKYLLVVEFDVILIPVVLIAANIVSRLMPVFFIFTSKYTGIEESSKSKPVGGEKSLKTFIIACIWGISPVFFLKLEVYASCVLFLLAIFLFFRFYVHKKINGYTGDVLGALQQISEIGFYLSFLIFTSIL